MVGARCTQKALASLEPNLPQDDVNKGDGVPTDGDLNTSNGAADGGGTNNSLEAPGENMNTKHGNTKGKVKTTEIEAQREDTEKDAEKLKEVKKKVEKEEEVPEKPKVKEVAKTTEQIAMEKEMDNAKELLKDKVINLNEYKELIADIRKTYGVK